MTDLSPAAQAVMDVTFRKWMEIDDIDDYIPGKIAAAALRAAADQVVPGDGSRRANEIRADILAIATELEGAQ